MKPNVTALRSWRQHTSLSMFGNNASVFAIHECHCHIIKKIENIVAVTHTQCCSQLCAIEVVDVLQKRSQVNLCTFSPRCKEDCNLQRWPLHFMRARSRGASTDQIAVYSCDKSVLFTSRMLVWRVLWLFTALRLARLTRCAKAEVKFVV